MSDQWVVVLRSGIDDTYVYGPLDSKETASRFADFLTAEVDPAHAYPVDSPVRELLLWWNRQTAQQRAANRPPQWPPQPGQVWVDRDGQRWIATRTGGVPYLVCIAKQADDSAEEIWRTHGPLAFVQFIAPTNEEEPPF